jgi:hypothetical protein
MRSCQRYAKSNAGRNGESKAAGKLDETDAK